MTLEEKRCKRKTQRTCEKESTSTCKEKSRARLKEKNKQNREEEKYENHIKEKTKTKNKPLTESNFERITIFNLMHLKMSNYYPIYTNMINIKDMQKKINDHKYNSTNNNIQRRTHIPNKSMKVKLISPQMKRKKPLVNEGENENNHKKEKNIINKQLLEKIDKLDQATPNEGWIKCNVHASLEKKGLGIFGTILRNKKGETLAANYEKMNKNDDPKLT